MSSNNSLLPRSNLNLNSNHPLKHPKNPNINKIILNNNKINPTKKPGHPLPSSKSPKSSNNSTANLYKNPNKQTHKKSKLNILKPKTSS